MGMRFRVLSQLLIDLEGMHPTYATIAIIGVTTGARIGEILELKIGDVYNKDGSVRSAVLFPIEKARKDVRMKRTMQPIAIEYLDKYRFVLLNYGVCYPEEYLFPKKLNRGFADGEHHIARQVVGKYFRRKFGNGYGTHWMRKTFAEEIRMLCQELHPEDDPEVALNTAIDVLQKELRHKRRETTMSYISRRDEDREELKRIAFGRDRWKQRK